MIRARKYRLVGESLESGRAGRVDVMPRVGGPDRLLTAAEEDSDGFRAADGGGHTRRAPTPMCCGPTACSPCIAPFNYPAGAVYRDVIRAAVAGNAVVYKHAEDAP